MNGFLVIARALTDDIPLALLPTEQEARDFLLALSEEEVRQAARTVYDIDTPDEICRLSIVPIVAGRCQQIIWPIIPEAA